MTDATTLVRLAPLGDTHTAPRHNPPLDPLDAFLEIPILPRTDCSLSQRECDIGNFCNTSICCQMHMWANLDSFVEIFHV